MTRSAAEPVTAPRVGLPVLPARYVVREQLLGPLRAAIEDSRVAMVLVSAPAGAGKTTLLAALAHDRGRGPGRDVAWLQVEAVDRDPTRFSAGVAAAVDRVRTAPSTPSRPLPVPRAARSRRRCRC